MFGLNFDCIIYGNINNINIAKGATLNAEGSMSQSDEKKKENDDSLTINQQDVFYRAKIGVKNWVFSAILYYFNFEQEVCFTFSERRFCM